MSRFLLCALSILLSCSSLLRAQGAFAASGNLKQARYSHTATLLNSGQVLVCGGRGSGTAELITAEVYNPVNGQWTQVPNMKIRRSGHSATLLTGGKVLVVGGSSNGEPSLAAEIYDPVAKTWTPVSNLHSGRFSHTATRLLNGQVLVTGGIGTTGTGAIDSVELFTPASAQWNEMASLDEAREGHFAALLPSGQVLVAGGNSEVVFGQFIRLASSEVYDPSMDQWIPGGNMIEARSEFDGVRLADNRILVAGGGNSSSEVFDPAHFAWTGSASMEETRTEFSMALLGDGRVLAAGGTDGGATLASADLFNAGPGFWQATAPMTLARTRQTSTRLQDGRVLVAGGRRDGTALAGSEIYTPGQEVPPKRLFYAQAVVGGGFSSLLFLTNSSAGAWHGRVELNGGNWPPGNPWSVNLVDQTGESDFDVDLNPGETVLLALNSTAGPFGGWLEILADAGSNVSDIASGYFYRFEIDDRLVASTGLFPATGARHVRFPVRKADFINTGMAIRGGGNFIITLYNADGSLFESVMKAEGGAFYFDQIFNEVPRTFLGSATIEAGTGFFVTVLRQDFDRFDPQRWQITSIPATAISESLP